MDDELLVLQIANGVIVEPSGLDATTAVEIQNRLAAVEGVAMTTNPFPIQPDTYVSSQSHGMGGAWSSVAMPAQQVLWTPIFVPSAFRSQAMAVHVSAAASGGALMLGLYGRDGSRLATYGSVAATSTGLKVAQIGSPIVVPAGLNWLCVHANNVSGISIYQLSGGFAMYHSPSDMTANVAVRAIRPYGSLPATVQFEAASGYAPFAALRVQP